MRRSPGRWDFMDPEFMFRRDRRGYACETFDTIPLPPRYGGHRDPLDVLPDERQTPVTETPSEQHQPSMPRRPLQPRVETDETYNGLRYPPPTDAYRLYPEPRASTVSPEREPASQAGFGSERPTQQQAESHQRSLPDVVSVESTNEPSVPNESLLRQFLQFHSQAEPAASEPPRPEEPQRARARGPDDTKLCIICCDNAVELAFVPCGHAITCRACATEMFDCCYCRQEIHDRLRIYLL